MVYDALLGGGLDKNIFNIVSNITAEEWLYLISQKETKLGEDRYNQIIPFLICTYDENKIMEMIQKSSFSSVSYALVDAWYSVIYGNTMVMDLQPSFSDIARKPALLHVFEGHLLRVIESADYEEDISSFITTKFKMMLREYTGVLTSKGGQAEGQKLLIGASSGTSLYPPVTDYSLDRLESVNNFIFFLSALDMCVASFQVTGEINTYDSELIRSGEFDVLIERNTTSRKQQYSCQNQFNEAYEYVLEHIERHMSRFSGFMFTDYEQELLTYVCEQKDLLNENVVNEGNEKISNQDLNEVDDLQLHPISELNGSDEIDIQSLKEPDRAVIDREEGRAGIVNIMSTKFKFFIGLFKGGSDIEKIRVTEEGEAIANDSEDSRDLDGKNDSGYEDILITGKKKGNGSFWLLGICAVVVVSLLTVLKNGDSRQSIIDKAQIESGEANVSEYKTIKVIQK